MHVSARGFAIVNGLMVPVVFRRLFTPTHLPFLTSLNKKYLHVS